MAQPPINKMPPTHALPPSLNYYCNVAHTAGDEEKAGRGEKRKREGGRMADHQIAHGLQVFALRGVQREHSSIRGRGGRGRRGRDPLCATPPTRVSLSYCNTTPPPPPPPSQQLPHPALPFPQHVSPPLYLPDAAEDFPDTEGRGGCCWIVTERTDKLFWSLLNEGGFPLIKAPGGVKRQEYKLLHC